MKRIIYFNTAVASSNMGDYIVVDACKKQLNPFFEKDFILEFPTHTPIAHFYQDSKRTSGGRFSGEADLKFIFGTNVINANMFALSPLWNINIFNKKMARGVICVGVGMGTSEMHPNLYTKMLLKSTLSKKYIHSTRDEKTASFLRTLGFKAINTGCVTTWNLDNNFCEQIPVKKADSVVFTLTDYKQNELSLIHI